MKHTLALSMIPVVLAWAGAAKPVPVIFPAVKIEPKNITPENITARRMDEGTFRARWAVVADLPPTIEVRQRPEGTRLEAASTAGAVALLPPAPPPSRQLSVQTVRRVALRSDICSRHGMRRVNYGKRWRCRR